MEVITLQGQYTIKTSWVSSHGHKTFKIVSVVIPIIIHLVQRVIVPFTQSLLQHFPAFRESLTPFELGSRHHS